MNNERIFGTDFIMNSIFDKITENKKSENSRIISAWEKVLKKINGCGQNLYENTSLIDIKNNVLLVEATHNGWIQMLQMNSKFILKGLDMYAKELNIKSLAFRLKGSEARLHEVNYDEALKSEMQKENNRFLGEEKIFEKYKADKKSVENTYNLPDELIEKFEKMKRSSV